MCTKDFSVGIKSFCLLEERRGMFLPGGIPHLEIKSIFTRNEIIQNKLQTSLF